MTHPRPYVFEESNNGCLEITSHRRDRRYTRLANGQKNILAHRWMWEECFGEIPEGMCVCHKCDNGFCVNPEHLFLGTHQDNMDDMYGKGRNPPLLGEAQGRAKLTDQAVRVIRSRYHKEPTKALAREYGVTDTAIRLAATGQTWRHVQ